MRTACRSRASCTSRTARRTVADLLELEVPVERALPYVLRRAARACASPVPEPLGRALVGAGGRFHRHSHAYTHDLVAAARDRRRATRSRRSTGPRRSCCPVYLAAFAPGHPDRMEAPEAGRHLAGADPQRPAARQRAGDRGRPDRRRDPGRHDRRGPPAVRRPVDHGGLQHRPRRGPGAAFARAAPQHGAASGCGDRGQPGDPGLRSARLPPRSSRRTQSISSARATIAGPSTRGGSVP